LGKNNDKTLNFCIVAIRLQKKYEQFFKAVAFESKPPLQQAGEPNPKTKNNP